MYIKDHPEVIIIDPIESVHKLFDRTTSYQIMKECEILEEGLWKSSLNTMWNEFIRYIII